MSLWHDSPKAWHEILPGVHRRILSQGHGVMMVLYRIAPNTTFPMHTHPHVQAGTCLEGGGRLTVGSAVYEVRQGSSYSIPSQVPHEFVTNGSGPSVVLDVFVPEREDFLPEALPPDQV